jgi:tRNA nucleotidyltransferase (CCA-adding enzyme)
MTDTEYLVAILKSQNLPDDSPELQALTQRRREVEQLLRAAFPDCALTIRYGGSKAKGTLIKESYDLDIVCSFPHDDTTAGGTLEEVYNNVAAALERVYLVQRRRSALRVLDKTKVDFHIDVVPGRFTDDTETDCFLHQAEGEKERLKTNLDVHIAHVRDSGFLDAIRLMKLWRTRKAISVKQFVFELLIIKTLSGTKKSLPEQLLHLWTELRDTAEPIAVEDPANPKGNDLSSLLSTAVWAELQTVARATLATLDSSGWEAVFGKVDSTDDKTAGLKAAAAAVVRPTKPWCS